MSPHKAILEKKLWAVADQLRGSMDANEYQKYALSTIFYKYLSELTENKIRKDILAPEDEDMAIEDVWNSEDYEEDIEEELLESLGFAIKPEYMYGHMVSEISKGSQGTWSVSHLGSAFTELKKSTVGQASQPVFEGLFEDVNLQSASLGSDPAMRSQRMGEIVKSIGEIDFHLEDTSIDVLGDAYEYMIKNFAAGAGKKGGEFYTPQEVSTLVSDILVHENPNMEKVYDPTCGSGSLLLRIVRESGLKKDNLTIYGQEWNTATYNLARMNMILHGVRWTNFKLENGNTLTDDKHPMMKFDAIGANPPYSLAWDQPEHLLEDERFVGVGRLAPKKAADFAFVQHVIHHMEESNGAAAIVLPHGVLFRGGAESDIRKHILESGIVHAVIGLPANLFYGAGLPTCILVLKKGKPSDDNDVLFIDASEEFLKGKNQNKLGEEDLGKILTAYTNREEVEKFARLVPMSEIEENEYNLNITRYVDISEDEEILDLDEVQNEIRKTQDSIGKITEEIEGYVSQLVPRS